MPPSFPISYMHYTIEEEERILKETQKSKKVFEMKGILEKEIEEEMCPDSHSGDDFRHGGRRSKVPRF